VAAAPRSRRQRRRARLAPRRSRRRASAPSNVSGVGTVVVDGSGRTVYILTSTGTNNVPCTDASGCTGLWPALPLPGGISSVKAGTGLDASLLGTKKLSDGKTYPTYHGWLMYEYAGDSGQGQAKGQGIKSFGGTWYVLNASGKPVTSTSGGGGGALLEKNPRPDDPRRHWCDPT